MTRADARYVAQTVARLTTARGSLEQPSFRDPVEDALTLHRIAGSLHRYDERACSEDNGCRVCQGQGDIMRADGGGRAECKACAGRGRTTGRREASLEAKAQRIAEAYGFRAYFQGDCRGCPLYLIPASLPEQYDASTYSSTGHAVVWLG